MTSIERVAKAIARAHFSRKQHVGACTKEERVRYMTDHYWQSFIFDAILVKKELDL